MDDILKMTDRQMWTTIVSFFLPWVIAVITKRTWTPAVKGWVSFGICVVVALGDAFFFGGLTGRNIIGNVLLVVVVTLVSYKALWKPTGVAEAIEAKVTI